MSIGNKLKELREKAGLNKKEVAEKLDMPYTTYNNYETDAREPGSNTLKMLAALYGVTVDYILEYYAAEDYEPKTLAAHADEEDWSPEEQEDIDNFKAYLRSKRNK